MPLRYSGRGFVSTVIQRAEWMLCSGLTMLLSVSLLASEGAAGVVEVRIRMTTTLLRVGVTKI